MENNEFLEKVYRNLKEIIEQYKFMPFNGLIEKWDIEERIYNNVMNYLTQAGLADIYDVIVYIDKFNNGYVDIVTKKPMNFVHIKGELL